MRVTVLPSFLQGWVLPRLSRFCKLYPHIRLVLDGSMSYADLNAGHVDCAIRFGHGRWPDVSTRPLMGDSLLLVASPKLLGKRVPTTLAQAIRFPVLHSSENWASWLASMGDEALKVQKPKYRLEFTDSTHLLEAVRIGMGVALTRRSIADQLLQRGEIVQVLKHECAHASSYCSLQPPAGPSSPAVEQWLGWLQLECSRYSQQQGWPTRV